MRVLNLGGEPVGNTYLDRAIALINRGDARLVESDESRIVRTPSGKLIKFPKVIELLRYIFVPFIDTEEQFTRAGVLRRDKFTCGYCGTKSGLMTWDHIFPKSRGGEDSWTNSITSCQRCNSEKGNMTLEEWAVWRESRNLPPRGLRYEPYAPSKRYFKSGKKPKKNAKKRN